MEYSLEKYSIETLQEEITRRKEIKTKERIQPVKIPKEKRNYGKLEKLADDMFNSIVDFDCEFVDCENIFEEVMKIFYGRDFWDWYNEEQDKKIDW